MNNLHKNKTFAAALALITGGAGLHRFYLYGAKDRWAWLHVLLCVVTVGLMLAYPDRLLLLNTLPLIFSVLIACIATFMIGLMPDEKWDALHNPESDQPSNSSWVIAVLMVSNLAYSTTLLLITMARAFDIILTGGSYG
jgi:TM2 domain-containing membrane protein YozV